MLFAWLKFPAWINFRGKRWKLLKRLFFCVLLCLFSSYFFSFRKARIINICYTERMFFSIMIMMIHHHTMITNQPTNHLHHLKHLIHGKMIWKSYFVSCLKKMIIKNCSLGWLVGWFDWQRRNEEVVFWYSLSSLIIMEYHQQQQQQ